MFMQFLEWIMMENMQHMFEKEKLVVIDRLNKGYTNLKPYLERWFSILIRHVMNIPVLEMMDPIIG